MDIVDFLASDNYIIINRELMMAVGLNEALVLGELASEYRYWKNSGKLKDGWFYSTGENLEKRLPLCRKTICNVIAELEQRGFLEGKLMDIPAKKYYRFVISQLSKVTQLVEKNIPNLVGKNLHTKNKEEEYRTNHLAAGDLLNCEDEKDTIPLAAVTTHHVEITVYDSDDSGKCINVKHQVSPKDWNKAVKKWRKNPAERVMMEFKDTGESERMTFNRIKKYNVRPQQQSLGYDRSEGTAFRINL